MKMKRYISCFVSVLLAGFLCSCNRDVLLPERGNEEQALMISPSLLGLQDGALTRADGDPVVTPNDAQFNENKVARLDVFIFKKADGSFVKDYHIDGLTPAMIVQRGGKEGYLLSIDWKKDGLDKDVEYKVYVVANSTNETLTTAGAVTTETALRALSTTDADIYKRFKEGVDSESYSSSKAFLMNATVDSWTIKNMATQLISDEQITVQRAAVKFVMDVSLSDTFKARLTADNSEYGTPGWKYLHFNTVTPEIPEGTAATDLATRGSGAYLDVVPGEDGHFIVTTYAYPQAWEAAAAADLAPAILISYPAVNNTTGVSNYHYYYIPLVAGTVTSTLRNHEYKVNAVISSYGSFETLSNDQVNLTYEVKDWTATEADVNAYAMDYLVVTPTRYSFKGGSEGEYLSKSFHYYASGEVSLQGVRAYYKNRTGAETDVTSGFTVSNPANGVITVTSTVPTNGTFRTLEFTVKCGNKTEKVIVRHYPADFVTGVSSSWCSYDDSDWAIKGTRGQSYCASGVNSSRFTYYQNLDIHWSSINQTYVSYTYSARMLHTDGNAYYMDRNGERSSYVAVSNVNNQMYVLQITSANDNYRIGRPNVVTKVGRIYNNNGAQIKTVDYKSSTDNVLSPAFMLASQLTSLDGAFSNSETSAIHCALYKEVDVDGNVYTGWRLPTKQEIEYMIENQTSNTQVMIRVLTGHYYYTLDGDKAEYKGYTGGDATYVRCVRDVSAEEIARLNQF